MKNPRIIYTRLAQAMAAAGCYDNDLVRELAVTATTVKQWKKGLSLPNVREALAVEELLKTPVHAIWFLEAKPDPNEEIVLSELPLALFFGETTDNNSV